MKKILLGNGAIAHGAINAGVGLVCGYPGTPSTEILQTVAQNNRDKSIYIEWSANEKAALEVAAGASFCGTRVLVTMKQVGLNVASDPVMSLAYLGVKGGMVIAVADDPGPISSQTEQDTRLFAKFANLPVLDPSSPSEAYDMTMYAFELSERIGMPIILRPTTKVCHASGVVDVAEPPVPKVPSGFEKSPRWVIFPPLSFRRHGEIKKQAADISKEFDTLPFNRIEGGGKLGIAASGVTYAIVKDIINDLNLDVCLLKSGAVYHSPEGLYKEFLQKVSSVLVLEELSPFIEEELLLTAAKCGIHAEIHGKLDGAVAHAGELRYDNLLPIICKYLGISVPESGFAAQQLPARAPVLCAGCPHRASFYAVKSAMKGKKFVSCGDIGCYTLGNAKPLEMTDTCLCMGAGITMAQGIKRSEPDTEVFAFIGDGTFFASGMTGVANAVYNNSNINIIILDNSTTAMTGNQPHPGTGVTMMDTTSEKIDILNVVKALNVGFTERVNPFELEKAVRTVKDAAAYNGVSVVIFESPCAARIKPKPAPKIEGCVGCMHCVKQLGCPALEVHGKEVCINEALCSGCGLCAGLCPGKKIIMPV